MSDAEVSNLTLCPVCKQTYTDPCQLLCRDTLCKKCFFDIEAAAAAADPNQQVRKCPVCARESPASGAELRADTRAAWIVRTRKAEAERQQRETAKGRCSLPHCGESAVSRGFYFEGTLCSAHVKTDEEKFSEIKLTAQSLLQSVRGLTQQRKDALVDLQAERADTAELFDAVEARLKRCRELTLGRLDSAIDRLKLELRAVEFIEKLQVQIQDAERVGDQVLSSRLFKQLHLSLADVDVKAGWASAADETVELAQHLLTTVGVIAADVENGKGAGFALPSLELREPACQEVHAKGITPVVAAVCGRTDGFYWDSQTGAVSKQCLGDMLPLPAWCVVAVGRKEASGYFAAAPDPRELLVQYFDAFGRFCGQFSLEMAPGAALVAVECSSGLQRLFLLANAPAAARPSAADAAAARPSVADAAAAPAAAPAAPAATAVAATSSLVPELTVTDLAGTLLQSVRDLQLGGPARGLTCCGDHLASVCVYVLGSGNLACLPADTCQIQECVRLPDAVKEARAVAASGHRLVLIAGRCVHLMNPSTLAVTRVMSAGERDPELKRLLSVGCGFVAVTDAGSRWLCFVARSGAAVRPPRSGPADPACVGRMESGLRIFALRPGK